MKVIAATALVIALLIMFGCAGSDRDWVEVERPLMRLESSLRHEPVMTVRSKIADLDAAVNWYVKSRPERAGTHRVQAIRQAIQHLEYALELPEAEEIPAPAWSKHGISTLGAQFISRKCSLETGLLYVNGADVPVAHLKQAQQLLAEARGTPSGQQPPPYDSKKEADACVQAANVETIRRREQSAHEKAEAARLAAEAAELKKREAAAWRAAHPLHVEFRARRMCSISVETGDRSSSGYVQAGGTLAADARETASVLVWEPDCWDISVNGSPLRPNFKKTQPGSAYQYETVIRLKDILR